MSRNLSVSNFVVGGSLTVTGAVTLTDTLFSSSSAEFVNLSITNLPTSSQIPSSDFQLTNKLYLDGQINTVNTNIGTNTTNIATNTTDISTNTTDISNNKTNISTNTTNIATNTTNIATNTTDISTNTTDISNNKTNISTNTTDISNLKTPSSGDILQMKVYNTQIRNTVQPSADGNGIVTIREITFIRKSTNSTILVHFDARYYVSSFSSSEIWNSFITIAGTNIIQKIARYGTASGSNNSELVLFPITGCQTDINYKDVFIRIRVQAQDANRDSNIIILSPTCTVTEIQN
jgi:hypothetical protein